MNDGEYARPLTRTAFEEVPLVSGYTTGRFRTGSDIRNVSSQSDQLVTLLISNTGTVDATLRVQETDAASGGTRSDVINAFTVKPGGQVNKSYYAKKQFMEVLGQSDFGQVRIQINSQLKWDRMAFDKIDTRYPTDTLVKGKLPDWPAVI